MPDNQEQNLQATPPSSQAEPPLKLLPLCMYCPECHTPHIDNDIGFSSDITGRAYGSAYLSTYGYIETETNDENFDLVDIEYVCGDDECDLSTEIRNSEVILKILNAYIRTENIALTTLLQKVQNYLRRNGAMSLKYDFEETRNPNILKYKKRTTELNEQIIFYIFHPKVYEKMKELSESDEIYKFDHENEIYTEANLLFNSILQITENEIHTNNQEALIGIPRIRDFYIDPASINITNQTIRRVLDDTLTEQESNPLNSAIYQPNDHRRWRDNNFILTMFTCSHCNYNFECDNELDEVLCPKCSKSTKNINEKTN